MLMAHYGSCWLSAILNFQSSLWLGQNQFQQVWSKYTLLERKFQSDQF